MSSFAQYAPVIVFFVAFVVFSLGMFNLGVEDAAIIQDSRHIKDARATWMSVTMVSAGVMLAAWVSRYGLKTGIFGSDNIKSALMSQGKI